MHVPTQQLAWEHLVPHLVLHRCPAAALSFCKTQRLWKNTLNVPQLRFGRACLLQSWCIRLRHGVMLSLGNRTFLFLFYECVLWKKEKTIDQAPRMKADVTFGNLLSCRDSLYDSGFLEDPEMTCKTKCACVSVCVCLSVCLQLIVKALNL